MEWPIITHGPHAEGFPHGISEITIRCHAFEASVPLERPWPGKSNDSGTMLSRQNIDHFMSKMAVTARAVDIQEELALAHIRNYRWQSRLAGVKNNSPHSLQHQHTWLAYPLALEKLRFGQSCSLTNRAGLVLSRVTVVTTSHTSSLRCVNSPLHILSSSSPILSIFTMTYKMIKFIRLN